VWDISIQMCQLYHVIVFSVLIAFFFSFDSRHICNIIYIYIYIYIIFFILSYSITCHLGKSA
jgi:hypothetical protein